MARLGKVGGFLSLPGILVLEVPKIPDRKLVWAHTAFLSCR